jgi:hypothetical protein
MPNKSGNLPPSLFTFQLQAALESLWIIEMEGDKRPRFLLVSPRSLLVSQ